jgi:4-amino-4-deoxy-L-arabinose transferase-like glycosyltransferase
MNKRIIIILGLIFAVAFFLRTYQLESRGTFKHDDFGYYSDTTQTIDNISKYTAKKIDQSFARCLLPMTDTFNAKPGHILLGLFSFYLLGGGYYSLYLGMAIWGVLTILLLFWIGYKLYSPEVGLLAALLLAVSSLHLDFSRSYAAHTDQCFFILLTTYLYILAKKPGRRVFLLYLSAGLCLGLAFIIHPQAYVYFIFLVLYEILGYFTERRKALSKKIFYTGTLIASALLPIILIEIISLLGKNHSELALTSRGFWETYFSNLSWVYNNTELLPALIYKGHPNIVSVPTGTFESYFGNLIWLHKNTKWMPTIIGNGLDYNYLIIGIIQSEGILFGILAFLSAIYLTRRFIANKKLADLIILAQSAILFFYWQIFNHKEHILRYIFNTLPFFCIAIGIMFYDIERFYKTSKYVLYWKITKIILIILLFIEGIWGCAKVIATQKTPYPKIENFILVNNIDKILTTKKYLLGLLTPNLTNTEIIDLEKWEDLREKLLKDNVQYALFYPAHWLGYGMYKLRCSPIAAISCPDFSYYPNFYAYLYFSKRLDLLKLWKNPLVKSITIYRIKDILENTFGEN